MTRSDAVLARCNLCRPHGLPVYRDERGIERKRTLLRERGTADRDGGPEELPACRIVKRRRDPRSAPKR